MTTPPKILGDNNLYGQVTKKYEDYSRPLLTTLLRSLKLDKNYFNGSGNWLEYKDKNQVIKVLDITGGYGANLLGHKNRFLMDKAIKAISFGAPSHGQGSIREKTAYFSEFLSDKIQEENSKGPWITHLTNSGSESVEVAIKHFILYQFEKIKLLIMKNIEFYNTLKNRRFSEDEVLLLRKILLDFEQKVEDLYCGKELLKKLFLFNDKTLNGYSSILAIEGAYHGKTLGSLSLAYNNDFKDPFFSNYETPFKVIHLSKGDIKNNSKIIEDQNVNLTFLRSDINGNLEIFKETYSRISSLILEPIQGEAGIIEIPGDFLKIYRQLSIKYDFGLISDEIQAGLYRTGKLCSFSHSGEYADAYCFSKGLGGGIAKIAATSFIKKKYIAENTFQMF